ncbi:hypothetical protein ACIPSA_31455 [Streptomyces sp. NPDC086549]|uniref:hypothetical protein n=1 Tax=Streptomyces sp. NPDC086549 TaxID=3365752 RepID=UPI00383070CD
MTTTKAVRVSLLHHDVRREAFADASRLRREFYECPTARRDELDATAVTAAQPRAVTERLVAARQWTPGDPGITIVMDAGYDVTRCSPTAAIPGWTCGGTGRPRAPSC